MHRGSWLTSTPTPPHGQRDRNHYPLNLNRYRHKEQQISQAVTVVSQVRRLLHNAKPFLESRRWGSYRTSRRSESGRTRRTAQNTMAHVWTCLSDMGMTHTDRNHDSSLTSKTLARGPTSTLPSIPPNIGARQCKPLDTWQPERFRISPIVLKRSQSPMLW